MTCGTKNTKATATARKKPGTKPWKPTSEEREMIEHYVSLGYTQEQIASLLGKSVDSMDRHCRRELDLGALQVNAKIGGKLFQKAMGGDTAALIFWAKTRLGWKETTVNEHSGKDGGRIKFDLSALTPDQVIALAKIGIENEA